MTWQEFKGFSTRGWPTGVSWSSLSTPRPWTARKNPHTGRPSWTSAKGMPRLLKRAWKAMHRTSGSRALRPVKLLVGQRKILSRKRYNLFHAVYSLITLDITAGVLLSHPCPALGDQHMCRLFACFLSNAGQGMHKVGGGAYFTHLYIRVYRYTHIYIYI